jgi:hypothetical protein
MFERVGTMLGHEAGDGPLGDVDAEFQKLALDARRTHSGVAVAIVLTSAATSLLTGARPPRDRPERRVQYSRKRRRCQSRTVSGETMTSACRQPVQTQARSAPEETVGRVELRAASCSLVDLLA